MHTTLRRSMLAGGLAVAALGAIAPLAAAEQITLEYAYWADPNTDPLFTEMFKTFEAAHPGVTVKPVHVLKDYGAKLTSMVVSGNAPDIAMMGDETKALNWAEQGIVLDLLPLINSDPSVSLQSRLKPTWYWYDHGTKTLGTNSAVEMVTMFYNRDAFQNAGIAEPSTDPDHAWNWSTFVADAKKLTLSQGNNVSRWGFSTWNWLPYFLPLLYSNNAHILNADGTKAAVTDPNFVHVVDELAKLGGEYHVSPPPFGSHVADFWAGKTAMQIDGQWSLGVQHGKNLGFTPAVAPLPIFSKPVALELGGPTVVFASTKHPQEAWELYKWTTQAQHVLPMLQSGGWMPLQTAWYTDPTLVDEWVNTPAHPYGYRDAVVKYLEKYGVAYPKYSVKNYDKMEGLIDDALGKVFKGDQSAAVAMQSIEGPLNKLVAGYWDR